MAPLRTLVLPAFAAVAAAQNIADYIPECGTGCIADTVDASTTCEADDAQCICAQVYTVKRNAEVCLRDGCSDSDYGAVMSGYDEFCKAVSDGPEPTDVPSSTSDTTVPPTTTSTGGYSTIPPPSSTSETTSDYSTSAPPPETTSSEYSETTAPTEYPTSAPPSSSSDIPSYPTLTSLSTATSIIETYSTSAEQPPTTDIPTDYPTTAPTTNGTVTTGYPTTEQPTSEPTGEPTIIPQPGAGARFEMNAAVYLGAALLAGGLAVFGL